MDEAQIDTGTRPAGLGERTSGRDVTHLLSQINQNFKQSKADQILRLLHDQDRLSDDSDECELIQEYNQIKEEKVVCDSDTLTDSSSDNETQITVKDEPLDGEGDLSERKRRSRTSMGFYNGSARESSDLNSENFQQTMERSMDTRERSARPKSSYVRRAYRRRDEAADSGEVPAEDSNQAAQRAAKSARPRARYGSAAARRMDRKIEMFEAGEINTLSGDHLDVRIEPEDSVSAPFTNRFSMMRTAKRESKKAKKFCEENNAKPVSTDTSGAAPPHVYSPVTHEEVTEVQINPEPKHVMQTTRVSSFVKSVPRTPYAPKTNSVQARHERSPIRQEHSHQRPAESVPSRPDPYTSHPRQDMPAAPVRQQDMHSAQPPVREPVLQNGHAEMETDPYPQEHVPEPEPPRPTPIRATDHVTNSHVSVRRNDSASGYTRPRNPEPIQCRPVEARPSTRRRLTRRYVPPSQVQKSSSLRPTSESVLLARQKTEKNLIKKQMDARPQSEKIIINGANKILSVSENPAQGPQTSFLTSKGGVPQPAHIQAGGFRGYDPASRMKSSSRSRADLPGDVTLPRPGIGLGARKPLALMKLPPLEAMAAKSKKERGLALAARETCV